MKKYLLLLVLLVVSVNAHSQHRHHGHRHYHNHSHNWIAPVIIGGIVGYAIAQNHNDPIPPNVVYPTGNNFYTCPFGSRPLYSRSWTHDRWGRSVLVDTFVGCQ